MASKAKPVAKAMGVVKAVKTSQEPLQVVIVKKPRPKARTVSPPVRQEPTILATLIPSFIIAFLVVSMVYVFIWLNEVDNAVTDTVARTAAIEDVLSKPIEVELEALPPEPPPPPAEQKFRGIIKPLLKKHIPDSRAVFNDRLRVRPPALVVR